MTASPRGAGLSTVTTPPCPRRGGGPVVVEPGRVFDLSVDLDGVPDGYRAMAAREALKVLIQP